MTRADGPDHRPTLGVVPDVDLFAGLAEAERAALAERLVLRALRRGEVLMRQGEEADALYVVLSGRFAVTVHGRTDPVSEIGTGQPAGEIAFLTGGRRTATVTAMRDGLVLTLTRDEFSRLVGEHPGIWSSLTTVLAQRLAKTTARTGLERQTPPRPRTVCIVPAGGARISPAFVQRIAAALGRDGRCVTLSPATAPLELGSVLEATEATARLNALEANSDLVLMVTDDEVTPWTEKAIRHADLVLAVASHADDPEPNAVELLAARFVSGEATRLVLLHPRRSKVSGTARWLAPRSVAMHHHAVLDDPRDIERLARFIEGRALGFVACGGGALAAAHTGVYKGLTEAGLAFDIMGGTSAGAALAAAFLLDAPPDEIDVLMGEMFVANRALRRYTLPRYGLLDHTVFDAELRRLYGSVEIEDLWLPFFAVSTNLSRFGPVVHRRGSLWRAIRASASIPVLLPPVYTSEGDMLVDGCLIDNVPVRTMRELKTGPNVVVSFKPPELDRFDMDYDALPSRGALMRLVINPLRRAQLPEAPGLVAVLMRALMVNRRDFASALTPDDISLSPPIPDGVGFLDWHRHAELFQRAYHWTRREIESLGAAGKSPWLTAALDP